MKKITTCEPLSSGSPDDMKNITPCEPSSLGKPSDMKQYDSSDSDMFVDDDYSSNKIVAGVNKNQNDTRVLRSNTRSVNYLEKSRKCTDDSDGYESEATYSNLRTARSPTERKNSIVTRNGSNDTRSA
jgi:hypothetical protein